DLVVGTDPVTCAPASGSLFPVGPSTVHCTSTDAHGNTAMATFTITVGYQWCGIGQPINGDGTSIFKLGSTVPIKFQLCGPSAGLVITAHIAIYFVSGGIPGTVNEATSNVPGDSGNTFRYDATTKTYIYNWSTKTAAVGRYKIVVDLGDGVTTN